VGGKGGALKAGRFVLRRKEEAEVLNHPAVLELPDGALWVQNNGWNKYFWSFSLLFRFRLIFL
jgi:hypothetical protein